MRRTRHAAAVTLTKRGNYILWDTVNRAEQFESRGFRLVQNIVKQW